MFIISQVQMAITADDVGNWLLVPTFFSLRSHHKLDYHYQYR